MGYGLVVSVGGGCSKKSRFGSDHGAAQQGLGARYHDLMTPKYRL